MSRSKSFGELKRLKKKLQNQLKKVENQLDVAAAADNGNDSGSVGGDQNQKNGSLRGVSNIMPTVQATKATNGISRIGTTESTYHDSKSGYLYKWQDRTIGWSGTKWDLRFVRLESGKLSYFLTHSDTSPRYILALRNCAVRDDGHKPNNRYWKRNPEEEVDLHTPGAYFHVFSIYQRSGKEKDNDAVEDEDNIVPLLRFSTQNYAEKNLWLELLSNACAFCDTDEFLKLERNSMHQKAMASSFMVVPKANNGTLPPMYFAPPPPPLLKRLPSHMAMKKQKSASYLKLNTSKDAPRSNSQRKSGYPASRPMHRNASPSYLSDEAPMQNYRGLLNLALIILVISNFRLLLETTREYGFVLAEEIKILESATTYYKAATMVDFPLLSGLGLLFMFVNLAYLIEKMISLKMCPWWFGITLHVINTNAALLVPTAIVWFQMDSVLSGVGLIMTSVILWMKLISYVHANADYRNHPERNHILVGDFIQDIDDESKALTYPSNITIRNLYYFWFAPTLTYQIVFPRLMRRNWIRILTLVVRLFLCNVVIVFLITQIISPNLAKLTKDLDNGAKVFSFNIFVDYLLKLALASTYIWLLVFYSYFHVFFNLLAEITLFGDRVFYKDWWNSSNVSAYWRLWNLPVHYWLVRHLYFPCIRLGVNKNVAMILVFFFSAVMHEYVISIPFHMIRPWSFLGMMGQVPLVAITKYFDKIRPGSIIGNLTFWLTFCIVGQPMAILMYTIDSFNKSGGGSVVQLCSGPSCDEL
mmetsp:Transcript_23842/g.27594  ORF Transcript_23842/g.27594 Transcript_23842/m.27594 type:complete len:757 (-) Transcript_23842:212-2482(-)